MSEEKGNEVLKNPAWEAYCREQWDSYLRKIAPLEKELLEFCATLDEKVVSEKLIEPTEVRIKKSTAIGYTSFINPSFILGKEAEAEIIKQAGAVLWPIPKRSGHYYLHDHHRDRVMMDISAQLAEAFDRGAAATQKSLAAAFRALANPMGGEDKTVPLSLVIDIIESAELGGDKG